MRKIITIFTFAFILTSVKAQTVSTYAGVQYIGIDQYNGTPNNTLTTEKFSQPRGIDIDSNGRIYITDDHNVLVLDGASSRIRAGYLGDPNSGVGSADGTGTVSRFNYPAFVAVDKKTINVYIADQYNNSIRKMDRFTTTGNGQGVSTFTGKTGQAGGYTNGATGSAKFNLPCGIAVSSDGNTIYIADNYNDVIRKVTGGQVTTIAGKYGKPGFADGKDTSAQFDNLFGLELKDDNTLIIADRNNFRIRTMNLTTGMVSTLVSGLSAPTDVAIVGSTYYIADGINIKRYVSGPSATVFCGSTTTSGYVEGTGATAQFGDLYGIVYSKKQDVLYVTDMGNNVVRKVTLGLLPAANFTTSTSSATLGQTVVLKNTSTNNPTSLLWAITPGTYTLLDGTTLTDDIVKVAFNATGGYTVELTATNGAGSNKKTANNFITVSSFPLNKSDVDFTADLTALKAGEIASFTETSTNSPLTFSWVFTPNTITYQSGTTATSRFPKVKFNQKGKYTVELSVTNANGNSSKNRPEYIIVDWPLGVSATAANEVKVYPNPSNGLFSISGVDKGSYSLFNASSQIISTGLINNTTVVDAQNLNKGVYFFRINTIDRVISKRVVIQ